MSRRSRRKKRAKARKISGVLDTQVVTAVTHASTQPEPAAVPGSGELLSGPSHINSDLRMFAAYVGCGAYSPEKLKTMMERIGDIVSKDDDRTSINAFKAILAQGKLALDIEKSQQPKPPRQHQHAHLHATVPASSDEGHDRVKAACERLGITLSETPDGK